MKLTVSILILLLIAAAASFAHAEQPADLMLGKVRMGNIEKLDGKARADVAAVAAKIKKQRLSGVVKVRGDFPGAETAEEYLSNSVFMAREVEKYLSTLLSAKFQVFVTASAYSGANRSGENSVEIFLYPYQLRLEEMESLRYVSTKPRIPAVEPVQETAVEAIQPLQPVKPAETTVSGGLLSAPLADTDYRDTDSKKARDSRISEDAARANELVKKAKARAAAKAKRRAAEK